MRKIRNYPFQDSFEIEGSTYSTDEIIEILSPIMTEERINAIESLLPERCRDIPVVTENLYDIGNINAIMRTMEAMGYHQLHNIENQELLATNRITKGADKWLDVNNWDNTKECITNLKDQGYKIVATHLSETAVEISDIDFTQKTAICFGHERDGISKDLLELADYNCVLPMVGFTQSYNVSVAAALSLQKIKEQRVQKLGKHGDLSEKEMEIVRASYYLMSATRPIQLMMKNLKKHLEDKKNESKMPTM